MKVTLESTATIRAVDGVPARLWVGTTETGFPVHAYIALISPQTHDADEHARFASELGKTDRKPSERAIDMRSIL